MSDISARGYVHPDVLVSTEWLAANLNHPGIRIVESNEDPLLYPSGHIPGAVEVDWTRDLNDQVVRDYVGSDGFQALASRIGITPETTVIFYGDKNNWWACYAFWVFQLFGHNNAKILDGGRKKWEAEGRELTRDTVAYPATSYPRRDRDDTKIRAFKDYVLKHMKAGGQLVDVRSPAEFTGEKTHMPEYPQEGVLRGGHIPGAKSVPWARTVADDGTFKDAEALKSIYLGEKAFDPKKETIAYCRIGERSSHTWFVLTYLLGFENVRNYDGSWTEWGNSVGVPIAKGGE